MQDLPLSRNGNTPANVAVQAIKKAGDYVRNNIYKTKIVTNKGLNNLVSNIDFSSEKIIIDILRREYPEMAIISEESSPNNYSNNYTWIVDPIDGTTNFVYGIPFVAINVALKYRNNFQLGITYDPLRKELFYAEKGRGSFLNGKPIRVSTEHNLGKAVVCCDLGYDTERGRESLEILQSLWGHVLCIRIMGSAALGLAYVACGRVDVYFHRFVYPWDISSGLLLITEAGGLVHQWTDQKHSNNTSYLVTSNKQLSNNIANYLYM